MFSFVYLPHSDSLPGVKMKDNRMNHTFTFEFDFEYCWKHLVHNSTKDIF